MYFYQNNRHLFFNYNNLNNNIQNNKFIVPIDSSMRLNELKQRTINKSTSNATKKTNINDTNSALKRTRNSGYVVPPKIQNKFLS